MSRKLLLLVISLVTGCESLSAGSGYQKHAAEPSRVTSEVASTFPQALQNSTPVQLTKDQTYKGAIQLTDAVLQIFDGSVYYKIFALPPNETSMLKIASLCSCLGFDKRIMPPMAFFLGDNGEQVGMPLTFDSKSPGWVLPVHYDATVAAQEIPPSAKFVLVAADPRVLRGGEAPTAEGYFVSPVPMVIPFPLGLEPTGTLWITYGSAP